MKFLANENFPFPSLQVLRELFPVVSISEDYSGISDQEVLKKAIEEDLIILTFDRDYGEIIFKEEIENPPSVVYFRLKGDSPEFAGELLSDLLQKQKIVIENKFTVIESNGIRQRSYKN